MVHHRVNLPSGPATRELDEKTRAADKSAESLRTARFGARLHRDEAG
jgi:hypothetical protein